MRRTSMIDYNDSICQLITVNIDWLIRSNANGRKQLFAFHLNDWLDFLSRSPPENIFIGRWPKRTRREEGRKEADRLWSSVKRAWNNKIVLHIIHTHTQGEGNRTEDCNRLDNKKVRTFVVRWRNRCAFHKHTHYAFKCLSAHILHSNDADGVMAISMLQVCWQYGTSSHPR